MVVTAIDRNKHEFDHVLKRVNSAGISDKISGESILCTGGQLAYNLLCNGHHLHQIVLNNARCQDGIFYIQNINKYHSQLKGWYLKMHGVASKYFPQVVRWFRILAWHQYQAFSGDKLT